MKNCKKIILFTFLFLIFFALSLQIAQAVEFKPNVQIPGTEFASVVNFEQTRGTYYIARYVMAIYNYGISVGAILATVVLMAAGLIWLTSGGSQEKIGQAKNMISGSIIGLVLLFGSYTILNMVNPELVNFHTSDIKIIKEVGEFCHPINGVVIHPEGAKKCVEFEECVGEFVLFEMGEGSDYQSIERFVYSCKKDETPGCCLSYWKIKTECRNIPEYVCLSENYNPEANTRFEPNKECGVVAGNRVCK